jgi:hypothetical protein
VLLRGNSTNACIFSSLSILINECHEEIIPKPNIFTGTRTQDSFRVCDLSSCILLTDMNKFYLGAILLSCLVSKPHKTSSSELKPRTVFRCRGLCSCNLLTETNFGFRTILSCLVSELQKPSSPGINPGVFLGFWSLFL